MNKKDENDSVVKNQKFGEVEDKFVNRMAFTLATIARNLYQKGFDENKASVEEICELTKLNAVRVKSKLF